jgi:hypothetical protein
MVAWYSPSVTCDNPHGIQELTPQDDGATVVRKAPPDIVMQSSTSTPVPSGKPTVSARRKMNQRSMSISESAANRPTSVFNIPPPPPFQPPAELKEAVRQPVQELQVPKLTIPRKKVSPAPADHAPVKAADPSSSGSTKPTIMSIVNQRMDDPVKSLVDALSESPTEIDSPAPPTNKPRQHLTPPPRTHSILSPTLPRARKSSLLSANIYRSHSNASDEGETNATEAFTRLTGQRAPSDIMRMSAPDHHLSEKFDRSATIKALSLMRSLELSMTVGCHITQRLYVPKNLWYQPNIRLPSLDVKVSVCESTLSALARLEAWHRLEDVKGTLSQLMALESCLENAQLSLSRKLGMPKFNKSEGAPAEPEIYRKEPKDTARKHQSIIAWGNKLSKSVERMNAFNLAKR